MKPHLKVVKPSNQNRTVPLRRPNAELRKREYLTPAEINKLIAAAKHAPRGCRHQW
jgi:type 1 fimbriae regulatory protein FimB/type 1 fimbriae regulatory protein FimE